MYGNDVGSDDVNGRQRERTAARVLWMTRDLSGQSSVSFFFSLQGERRVNRDMVFYCTHCIMAIYSLYIQLTLVISISLISNNRISRSENYLLLLRSNFSSFPQYFQYI